MPEVFRIYGYKIYFYSNENDEPCHVHVAKGQGANSKIWIEPEVKIAHNKAKIPKNELKKIVTWLEKNKDTVLTAWNNFFSK